MIVLDASAAVELLLRTVVGVPLAERVLRPSLSLHAPHLLDVEVAQVLRRFVARGYLTPERAREALEDLAALPLERYSQTFLLPRIWELQETLTAYDAAYVALAEILGAKLLTGDRRLSRAPGHSAQVEVLGVGRVSN
ncbi:MAG TPA: type II toxin-antitoxin system VapC family toxin [Thermoanaerobaculia bacterium]|nr:type II toxin-antitoxin system VapC family toxin [Thermoanaerobaculia bacterium]